MRATKVYLLLIAVLTFCTANLAFADMVLVGPVDFTGTGFGHIHNYIMTMQSVGQGGAGVSEQGCSGWDGTKAIISPTDSACAPGYTGLDTKGPAGFPKNDVTLLSNLGIHSASEIAIIFNPDQKGSNTHQITLTDLTITLWDSTGKLIWNSDDITGGNANGGDANFFATSDPGVGKSGFLYVLDGPQAAALDAMHFDFTKTAIGLSASATGTDGGPDGFWVTQRVIPEPSFLFVSLAGLALTVTVNRLRRRRA